MLALDELREVPVPFLGIRGWEFHPDGRRFLIKPYPKDKEFRRLKLSPQIAAKLKARIKARGLGPDGLLFARRASAPAPLRVVTEPGILEFTKPNDAGRQYRAPGSGPANEPPTDDQKARPPIPAIRP